MSGPPVARPHPWLHVKLRLDEPVSDQHPGPTPPDLHHVEMGNVPDWTLEMRGRHGAVELYLATPAHTGFQQALSHSMEEAYHGHVHAIGNGETRCPFDSMPQTGDAHVVVGRFTVPDYHLVDIGGWTDYWPPKTLPPKEWDLSTTLFRNLEAWMRTHPASTFTLSILAHRTGQREPSLLQWLRSEEDKVALRARGFTPQGPLGLYGMAPPQRGSEPTLLDDDYHSRYSMKNGSHSFHKVELRAEVTGDVTGFLQILNGWAAPIRYRTRGGLGQLYRFEEIRCGLLAGAGKRAEILAANLQALRDHAFLPHGGNRKGHRSLTSKELWKILPIPWERRHSVLALCYRLGGDEPGGPSLPCDRIPSPRVPAREDREQRFRELAEAVRTGRPLPSRLGKTEAPVSRKAVRPAAPPSSPAPRIAHGPLPTAGFVVGHSDRESRDIVLPLDPGHTDVVGGTAKGKSTHVLNTLLARMRNSPPEERFVVVEPAGTLAKDIRNRLTPEEAEGVIEIDLDPDVFLFQTNGVPMVSIAFNVLHVTDRDSLSEGLLAARRDILIDDFIHILTVTRATGNREDTIIGQRMESVYKGLLPGLMERADTNLHDLYQLLLKDRHTVGTFMRMVRSEACRSYVNGPLRNATPEYLQSSQNPIGTIVNNSILSGALCQRVGVVTFGELLKKHRLLIINLNKGKIGKVSSRILGATFITQLWITALQSGEKAGPWLHLFVDEWHNFVSKSFTDILSEGAKYGIRLVLANQYMNQIPEEIRDSLKNNISTWAFFHLGPGDARFAAEVTRSERFGTRMDDFYRFPKGYAAFSLDSGSEFIAGQTLPPPPLQPEAVRKEVARIILENTRRYAAEETSKHSPYKLDVKDDMLVLRALLSGAGTLVELENAVPMHRHDIYVVLHDRLQPMGYIEFREGRNEVTALGRKYFEENKKSLPDADRWAESEEHKQLLAEYGLWLERTEGIKLVKVVPQRGVPTPDAYYEREGVRVNVETEWSLTNSTQVVLNRDKVRAGEQIDFVVATEKGARDVGRILVENGRDGSVIMIRSSPGQFTRHVHVNERTAFDMACSLLVSRGRSEIREGWVAVAFPELLEAWSPQISRQELTAVLQRLDVRTVARRPEKGGTLVLVRAAMHQKGEAARTAPPAPEPDEIPVDAHGRAAQDPLSVGSSPLTPEPPASASCILGHAAEELLQRLRAHSPILEREGKKAVSLDDVRKDFPGTSDHELAAIATSFRIPTDRIRPDGRRGTSKITVWWV